jgi:hypothetical protein
MNFFILNYVKIDISNEYALLVMSEQGYSRYKLGDSG